MLVVILCLSSALSAALSVARIGYSGVPAYFFLNWNLILAWFPLLVAAFMWWLAGRGRRTAPALVILFGVWLVFFPNAPYLVSDLIHLNPRNNVPLWYDVIMIFSFAWNGLILGFLSLWIVQELVAQRFGRFLSWLMVLAVLTATGFGIYLGRFERWNSWDVLVDPTNLLRDVVLPLTNPFDHPRTIGVTLLFAGFLTISYLTLTLLPAVLRSGGRPCLRRRCHGGCADQTCSVSNRAARPYNHISWINPNSNMPNPFLRYARARPCYNGGHERHKFRTSARTT